MAYHVDSSCLVQRLESREFCRLTKRELDSINTLYIRSSLSANQTELLGNPAHYQVQSLLKCEKSISNGSTDDRKEIAMLGKKYIRFI